MHNTTFALTLLALFTTPEKAAEIEGDLLEQSRSKGRLWFWLHVKLMCLALFFHGLRQEAGKVLLFSYATYELVLKLNWWALRPLRREARDVFDQLMPVGMVNDCINILVGFCIGMLIARVVNKHAGQIIVLTIVLFLGRTALLESVREALEIALFAATPGVLGALLMQWLQLRRFGITAQPLSQTPR